MNKIYTLCFLAVVALAADPVQPLNLKAGMWETTISTRTTGTPPLPAEVLAKLTPEQRARLDAAQAKANDGPPEVTQKCVSKEELAKTFSFADQDNCRTTVVSSTSTRLEGSLACSENGVAIHGKFKVEAPNPESVKFTYEATSGEGSGKMVSTSTGAGKWLSADCAAKESTGKR